MDKLGLLNTTTRLSAGPPLTLPQRPAEPAQGRGGMLPIKAGPDGRAYLATARGSVALRWADGSRVMSTELVKGAKVQIDQVTGVVRPITGG